MPKPRKQHLNQTSSKKKTPQKISKRADDGRKNIRDIEKSCEQLVLLLSEQSTLSVYLFDMMDQFAYTESDSIETTPEKVSKLLMGVRHLNKFRKDTLIKVIQVTQFKSRIKELYSIVKKEDFFNEKFVKLTEDVQRFMETSMDVMDSLQKFWDLYKIELMNSTVSENFVVKLMKALSLPEEEINSYLAMKQKEPPKIDTSELFKDEPLEINQDTQVIPE